MDFAAHADPELLPILDQVVPIDLRGDIPTARAASAGARAALLAQLPEVPDVVSRDEVVPGAEGDPDVVVRVYQPAGGHNGAALSYVHGGGMVLMSIEDTDFLCRRIVANIGCLVTSVDYRLAPEHPYPAAIHDCHAALAWLHGHAGELGVDPARIAIGGSSAGGGLAAGTALLALDRGEIPLCFQWLIYPMIDDRNETPSSQAVTEPRVWNRASNLRAWEAYLGPRWGSAEIPRFAAPARASVEELRGLPPTYIDVGELDPFRDEDIAYASALLAAGVPTELHVTPGVWHASENMVPTADSSRRILRSRMQALARAIG